MQTHRNSCTRTHTYKQTHWHTRHKQNEGVAPENVRTRGWEWELSGKTEDEAAAMRLYLVPLRNYGSGNNNATGLLFLVAFTSRTHTHNLMWDTQAHTHRHTDVRWHCNAYNALSAVLLACDLGTRKHATLAINFHLNYTHTRRKTYRLVK